MFASPPKGRTARRRSRSAVRSGAHAIEEARKRSVCNAGDHVVCQDIRGMSPTGMINNELFVGKRSRAKCDAPAPGSGGIEREFLMPIRHIEQPFQHKCQQYTSPNASVASLGANHQWDVSGTPQIHPLKSTEGIGANVRKLITHSCGQNLLESHLPMARSNSTSSEDTATSKRVARQTQGHHSALRHLDSKCPSEPVMRNRNLPENTPTITLGTRACGRDANAAQDIGNYRMLIDDLSYLCSAVIQSRTAPAELNEEPVVAVHKHSPVTAGAACDIAELVSQSATRSKLLIVSAEGARVGALGAVLESIACAPPVIDMSATRSYLVDGQTCLCGESEASSAHHSSDAATVNSALASRIRLRDSEEERGKYDVISSKALSIVAYFVGADCTASDKAESFSKGNHSFLAVQMVRESVLRHKSALLGLARLVANDPLVCAYLKFSTQTFACGVEGTDDSSGKPKSPSSPSKSPSPSCDVGQILSVRCDPTKLGRRSRKKRKQAYPDLVYSSKSTFEEFTLRHSRRLTSPCKARSSLLGQNCEEDRNSLGFSLEDQRSAEHSGVDKHEEKISLAYSRTNLTKNVARGAVNSMCNPPPSCQFCSTTAPHMISTHDIMNEDVYNATSASSVALFAATCIITGRNMPSTEHTMAGHKEVSEDLCHGRDLCYQHPPETMSRNPITHANEMMRLSGSLPHYSCSMCDTLMAILLSLRPIGSKNQIHGACTACTTYLQHRASHLSEVIDSLCCLSPSVSVELSNAKFYLVPSLLRAVAEISFAAEINQPSICHDSLSTVLKTLTSLTHENAVACEQILQPFCWEISLPVYSRRRGLSGQITGLDIVFSYLYKTASLSLGAPDKARYDSIIFSLNILTNIVEMVPDPTCRNIESILLRRGSKYSEENSKASGLSWLTHWLVTKTAGFQSSVMRGTFGSNAVESPAADSSELKSGDDDNLVTTGNGFVFLACLLISDSAGTSDIRDVILSQLPLDEGGSSGGIQFMIRTLKAFCNFYHFSVGDLSVAVIAPVVKLIAGLEKMN